MLPIHTILHPTDFSDAAMEALQLARSLARDHGAKLVILGVTPPPPPVSEVYAPLGEMSGQLEELRRQLASLVSTITEVPVETHALHGVPGPAIVSTADECQADLIVMGTHGRTGLTRLVMGSVAEDVMRHAHCPVLTVKPGAKERVPREETAGQTVACAPAT
jgi:nucleotide-binding universal stress UspA family protein